MVSFHRTPTTWAAYIILALYSGSLAVISAAMPFVRAELGLNYATTAAYLSALAVGILTAGLSGDRLVRRFGRKALFYSAAGLEACALALVALARVPILVLAGVYLIGLGGALTQITVQIILSDLHQGNRAVAISEANLFAGISTALTPLFIGGIRAAAGDWRPVPLFYAAVIAVWASIYWRVPVPAGTTAPSSAVGENRRLPPVFFAILPAIFLVVSAEWSIAFWTPDFLHRIAGFSIDQASALLSVYFTAIVVGRLAGSIFSRRFSDRAVLFASLAASLAGLPLYWLAPWPVVRLAGLFITGVGIGNHYPMLFSFAMGKAANAAGAANSLAETASSLAETASSLAETASSRTTLMAGAAIFSAPLLLGGLADRIGIFASLSLVAIMLLAALTAVLVATRLNYPRP